MSTLGNMVDRLTGSNVEELRKLQREIEKLKEKVSKLDDENHRLATDNMRLDDMLLDLKRDNMVLRELLYKRTDLKPQIQPIGDPGIPWWGKLTCLTSTPVEKVNYI